MALASVFGVCSTAMASFDLILATQSLAVPNGPIQVVISRWDPINRVSLGYFTAPGVSSSSSLMLDPSRPGVVTAARPLGGTVRLNSYFYSTGEYLGETTLSTAISTINSVDALSGGSFLLTGSNAGVPIARIVSSSGATTRTYSLPSGTLSVEDAVLGDDGVTHILTRQAGTTSNSRYTLSSYASGTGVIATSTTVIDNTTSIMTNLVRQDNWMTIGGDFLSSRRTVTLSGTLMGPVTLYGGFVVETSRTLGGHGNMIHGIGYDAGTSRTYVSTALNNAVVGNNYFFSTSPAYIDVYDAVIVVAPEPGTMIALGAGLAMILRRKRARK